MKTKYIIDRDSARSRFIEDFYRLYGEHKHLKVTIDTGMQRTSKQNRALHKFCQMLADALNAAGLDQRKLLKPGVEIPWSMLAVKECLWKPIQDAVIGKESTADADRDEYSKVYEVLNRNLGAKFGVHVPWPEKKQPNNTATNANAETG